MMGFLKFLSPKVAGLVAGGVLLAFMGGKIWLQSNKIEELSQSLEMAQRAESRCLGQVETLEGANSSLVGAVEAEQAACRNTIASLRESIDQRCELSRELSEVITVEREADVTLDQCMSMRLPDSILRKLPR